MKQQQESRTHNAKSIQVTLKACSKLYGKPISCVPQKGDLPTMYVQSLNLENIKAFEALCLEFARPNTDSSVYAGMNVFVGGNASGKSTLLKCIALALSGPTVANQQLLTPDGWVRQGTKQGTIELKIQLNSSDTFRSNDTDSASRRRPPRDSIRAGLTFDNEHPTLATVIRSKDFHAPNNRKFLDAERGPWNSDTKGWMLSAYGPLRRLTGSSTEGLRNAMSRGKLASCVTLFREDAALSESETWLKQEYARSLEQKNQKKHEATLVEQVQEFLNDSLLPPDFGISRISVDKVYMKTPNGGDLPMRDLSDGCRSAFALMLDIIRNMALTYGEENIFETDDQGRMVIGKPGVILIDEIEAHLHPSWQQQICEWLKTRFPQVQFFVTTHSPLLAQAADPGGLFVLPLPNEIASGQTVRRLQPHEQERVTLGRAEKVLLGEAFGLQRTWSTRADTLVQRWQKLSALRNAKGSLPAPEQHEYEELSKQMEIVFDDSIDEA